MRSGRIEFANASSTIWCWRGRRRPYSAWLTTSTYRIARDDIDTTSAARSTCAECVVPVFDHASSLSAGNEKLSKRRCRSFNAPTTAASDSSPLRQSTGDAEVFSRTVVHDEGIGSRRRSAAKLANAEHQARRWCVESRTTAGNRCDRMNQRAILKAASTLMWRRCYHHCPLQALAPGDAEQRPRL